LVGGGGGYSNIAPLLSIYECSHSSHGYIILRIKESQTVMDIFLSVQLIYRFFPCLHVEVVVDQFHQDLTQVRGVQLTLMSAHLSVTERFRFRISLNMEFIQLFNKSCCTAHAHGERERKS